ncbi:MAG: DNA-3-methyladenine glycosylase I [Planctomycetes bacterium]|nr:DNA-3-methyladenine glycosylase I [Planctomycetota bacterium]
MCATRRPDGVVDGGDGVARCWWCGEDAEYRRYHDEEWGVPVDDDRRLFEKICLEGFQAGLSWITILRKRENFRARFRGFDLEAVAKFGKREVERALRDEGIVRHRGKIESTINNARRALEVVEELGSLAALAWSFEPAARERARPITRRRLLQLARTPESTLLSKTLKKRGFSYVGPTTMYAFMQSVGIVNDHLAGCARQAEIERLRSRFERPVRNP